ncbi:MAG: DNA-directed RNA polymerase subunit alpha C-terminal domain-containing protein [Candidatus Anammoxibacter sp.]
MTSENIETEYDIDGLLNIDDISAKTLSRLKLYVYGNPEGKAELKSKIESIEDNIKKNKDTQKLNEDYLLLSICFMASGKTGEALEILKNVKHKHTVNFLTGVCYREAENYKEALEYFEKALGKGASGDDYVVQMEIAASKRKSGDAKGAKQIIETIAKENSNDPELHYQLGHCEDDMGNKEEAWVSYERALELDPEHPQALFRMAYNCDLNHMDDEAIELYEMCNESSVKYVNSFLNLGILYEDKSEYEKAISCFKVVLDANPNNLRARMYLKDAKSSVNMYYDETVSKSQIKDEDIMSVPISEFELSVRSRNCLEKMSINTLGDLAKVSEHDLLSYKNFGETSLYEIRNILKQKGLRLGQDAENVLDNPVIETVPADA